MWILLVTRCGYFSSDTISQCHLNAPLLVVELPWIFDLLTCFLYTLWPSSGYAYVLWRPLAGYDRPVFSFELLIELRVVTARRVSLLKWRVFQFRLFPCVPLYRFFRRFYGLVWINGFRELCFGLTWSIWDYNIVWGVFILEILSKSFCFPSEVYNHLTMNIFKLITYENFLRKYERNSKTSMYLVEK